MQPLTFAAARHQLLLKELRPQNEEKVRATTALPAAASSHGGHQQQQLQGGRRPNTKQAGQQPFPHSSGGNKRVPRGFNPWTGERVAPGERVTPPGQRRRAVPAPPEVPAPGPGATRAYSGLPAGQYCLRSAPDLLRRLQHLGCNRPHRCPAGHAKPGDRIVDSGASTHMTSSAVELAALAKTQFSSPIKCLQADNGTEFINTATIKFFTAQGTHLRYSCPYTSSQNGKAERIIRTLNNSIRTMLLHASLPPTYRAEGLPTACYLHNRRPSSSIQHDIPFTRPHNQPPTYNHLRVFGCLCYPNMQATSKHKLAPRSTACVFLGYPPSHKGYRCLDLSTRRIIISRHVIFDETTFPFAATSDASPPPPPASYDFFLDDDMVSVPCSTVVAGGTSSSTPVVTPSSSDVEQPPPDVATSHGSPPPTPGGHSHMPPPGPGMVPFPRVYVRRPRPEPSGAAAAPQPLPDAPAPASITAPPPPPPPPRITRTMTGAIPRVGYEGPAATTSPSPSPIPTSYRGAPTDARRRAAMMDEYRALVDNNTWQLVPRPPDANIVTGKWIFRHKFHADGSLARHKARRVVRGFSRREGVDYDETFGPVVKPATIRSVLGIAASRARPIHRLDVKNAFLHGHLEETVYRRRPPGFVDPGAPDHVRRLRSPCMDRSKLRGPGTAASPPSSGSSASSPPPPTRLFSSSERGRASPTYLLYVDDIVLTASSSALLRRIMTRASSEFAMTDLGDLHHFLGIAVTRSSMASSSPRRRYAVELLQRAGMGRVSSDTNTR
ncbi:hypothetical protein U9M48_016875 [Paspalum notatum var. saurae]|uniref:Integrase catalytic domain-containing protein n=1 Tax=Paspalum notatum var. saurae TaxID=547442 RepID=A0AAQ3WNR3_PASNO